jgi:hypothetical protein
MVHGPAVDKVSDLGMPDIDGLANYVRGDERVYVSLANHGWLPLTDD